LVTVTDFDSSHLQVFEPGRQLLVASVGAVEVYNLKRKVYVPLLTFVPSALMTFPWKFIRLGLTAWAVLENTDAKKAVNTTAPTTNTPNFARRNKNLTGYTFPSVKSITVNK
jgi:hypothetical protein